MKNIFSGLEQFGLNNLQEMNVFEKEDAKQSQAEKKEPPKVVEADLLFDKTFVCPVCDNEFKSKTVKTGKIKLLSADSDLRPKYQHVDSLKYDAILCPKCGYAALNRYFNFMTSVQGKLIREKISANYKAKEFSEDTYSYDEAINRHKMALLSTIVSNGKNSERAYTCLKLAWLVRGKSENLPADTKNIEQVKNELTTMELDFIQNAYEGFSKAFSTEPFPMCGMDENTMLYLIADLARRCGKFEESARYVSQLLVAKDATDRLKAKARELKEILKQDLSK